MNLATLNERDEMARPKRAEKTIPVRLTEEAIKWARIASGYTGESMADYVSRTIVERGKEDSDRMHADLHKPAPKPKGK
jgi:hypothetical protein